MSQRNFPRYRMGIGQESHRFLSSEYTKPCVIAGLVFEDTPGLSSDSDGDVVFHALCNAISSVCGVPILTGVGLDLCTKDGITDSAVYVEKALEALGNRRIEHVAFTIEGKRPRFDKRILEMRKKIASVLHLELDQVGLTAAAGDGLTDFGCGEGLQCFCILTTVEG
jgi:2-C-methyl-D-erythritol 2,4-cyclodiphosphate synthase